MCVRVFIFIPQKEAFMSHKKLLHDLKEARQMWRAVDHFLDHPRCADHIDLFQLRHILRSGIILPILARFMEGRRRKPVPQRAVAVMVEVGDVSSIKALHYDESDAIMKRYAAARTRLSKADLRAKAWQIHRKYTELEVETERNAKEHRY